MFRKIWNKICGNDGDKKLAMLIIAKYGRKATETTGGLGYPVEKTSGGLGYPVERKTGGLEEVK